MADLALVSAVAWGMVDGPPFEREAEKRFRACLNKELMHHGLWMTIGYDQTSTTTVGRYWLLYPYRCSKHEPILRHKLQDVCQYALRSIRNEWVYPP